MKIVSIGEEPYYCMGNKYPLTNTEKAKLGEEAFQEALSDYPVLMNITYGKRQKDIDHLVLTPNSLIMNECKNTFKDFFVWSSWCLSHVVDRFVEGYPIAEHYARTLGYSPKNIIFTLTIPRLNTNPLVKKILKGLKIHVIETEEQVLNSISKKKWYAPIRKQILSVINTSTSTPDSGNTPNSSDSPSRAIASNSKDSKSKNNIIFKKTKMNHSFPETLHHVNRYCENCTKRCLNYYELRKLVENIPKGLQTDLVDMNPFVNCKQQKDELKALRRDRRQRIMKLADLCTECARRRFYQYIKPGYEFLFDFPEGIDIDTMQITTVKEETKSRIECEHSIEIRCEWRSEPWDLCLKRFLKNKKRLVALLRRNRNKCKCDEIFKEHCPYHYSCEKVVARALCPENHNKTLSK